MECQLPSDILPGVAWVLAIAIVLGLTLWLLRWEPNEQEWTKIRDPLLTLNADSEYKRIGAGMRVNLPQTSRQPGVGAPFIDGHTALEHAAHADNLEVIEAGLRKLGYGTRTAKLAVQDLPVGCTVEEGLKLALRRKG